MRKIYKIFDWIVSLLLFLGLLFSFTLSEHKYSILINWVYVVLGLIGIIYTCYALYRFILCKIEFDLMLVKGNFIHKVINLTLLIPFALTFLFISVETNNVVYDKYSQINIAIKATDSLNADKKIEVKELRDIWDNTDKNTFQSQLAKKLVFSENLYARMIDTIVVTDTADINLTKTFAEMTGWEMEWDTVKNKYILLREMDVMPQNIIDNKNEEPSLFWSVYYHYIDPGNQHIASTERGRKWGASIAIMGYIFLNGLFVAVLIGWFDRRRDEWTKGEVRYKLRNLPKNRFTVVIGANEVAPSVIKNLLTKKKRNDINFKCEGKNKYIILQTSRDTQTVREELAVYLDDKELQKVIVYKALRNSKSEIEKLYLRHCTEIYVLGESTLLDGGETYHDAMNMKCVNLIAEDLTSGTIFGRLTSIICNRSNRKLCKVMLEYQTTYSIFQFSDVPENIKHNLVFVPFNRYESWARKVMVESCSKDSRGNDINYTPLDGKGISANDFETHVHFVIVGMSKMGVAMGIQSLLEAHYLNFAAAENEEDAKKRELKKNKTRTRITFIDTNADKEMNFFKGRYMNLFSLARHRYFDANDTEKKSYLEPEYGWIDPMLDDNCKWKHLSREGQNFIDVEIEFVRGELESEGVRQYLRNISDKNNDFARNSKLTVAICLTQTHQAVAASLYMPIEIYEKTQEIWVYQCESSDIILNLTKTKTNDKRYEKLRPFGMLYGEYMSDRAQYLRALLVNEAYNIGANDGKHGNISMNKKKTYKHLRESWKGLSLDKKFSNRYFADSIYLKVRSVLMQDYANAHTYRNIIELVKTDDFLPKLESLLDNDNLAISEHNRWDMQQLLFGYSPCDYDNDMIFKSLNSDKNESELKIREYEDKLSLDRYNKKWKYLNNIEQSNLRNDEYAKLEKEYKQQKELYKDKKDECKNDCLRIHPNICEYHHLDEIDSGAKDYDITLNKAIPRILELVYGQ